MYLNNLFVYGTLLPGLENHQHFIETYRPKVYEARARGVMYYLPGDDYPVVLEGEGEIKGVVFECGEMPIILTEIDEIEKYTDVESQSHLIREIQDVVLTATGKTIKAHVYLWPPSRAAWLREKGQIIEDGDWLAFLEKNGKL